MFDKKYFRERLPLLVQGYGGLPAVRIRTFTGEDYLLRRVIKTDDGHAEFEVHLDMAGDAPVIDSTSNSHDFDTTTPFTSKAVAVAYENIADVLIRLSKDPKAIFH